MLDPNFDHDTGVIFDTYTPFRVITEVVTLQLLKAKATREMKATQEVTHKDLISSALDEAKLRAVLLAVLERQDKMEANQVRRNSISDEN